MSPEYESACETEAAGANVTFHHGKTRAVNNNVCWTISLPNFCHLSLFYSLRWGIALVWNDPLTAGDDVPCWDATCPGSQGLSMMDWSLQLESRLVPRKKKHKQENHIMIPCPPPPGITQVAPPFERSTPSEPQGKFTTLGPTMTTDRATSSTNTMCTTSTLVI